MDTDDSMVAMLLTASGHELNFSLPSDTFTDHHLITLVAAVWSDSKEPDK